MFGRGEIWCYVLSVCLSKILYCLIIPALVSLLLELTCDNSNITMKRKHLRLIKENLIKFQCSVTLSEHFIYFSEIRFYYTFFFKFYPVWKWLFILYIILFLYNRKVFLISFLFSIFFMLFTYFLHFLCFR